MWKLPAAFENVDYTSEDDNPYFTCDMTDNMKFKFMCEKSHSLVKMSACDKYHFHILKLYFTWKLQILKIWNSHLNKQISFTSILWEQSLILYIGENVYLIWMYGNVHVTWFCFCITNFWWHVKADNYVKIFKSHSNCDFHIWTGKFPVTFAQRPTR